MRAQFIKNRTSFLSNLVLNYMPGLWNALVNLLVFVFIDLLAKLRKYPDFVSYHRFISRVCMFYLTINIILLPLASISVSYDIVDLAFEMVSWQKFNQKFIMSQSGTIIVIRIVLYNTTLPVCLHRVLCCNSENCRPPPIFRQLREHRSLLLQDQNKTIEET